MTLQDRINAFAKLGDYINNPDNTAVIEEWAYRAQTQNNWFTPENVFLALNNIANGYLKLEDLQSFAKQYQLQDNVANVRKIGLILAGNIPAVGFHDVLMVLLSGNECRLKLSSQDTVLMKALLSQLLIFEPNFKIQYVEQLKNIDLLIATGSDNTFRYFEYYFRDIPHIIRQNRSSVAVLNGTESADELLSLGKDITSFYGLGCRNISKIYVPENYKFDFFYESIESLGDVFLHHKYKNNYDYNKSIYLVNGEPHLDNGFLILRESEEMVSPISVIFYEKYQDEVDLSNKINSQKEKVQCIVSQNAWLQGSLVLGNAQQPSLVDYADGFDTMQFLLNS
ncbi:MAG: acyl-CoA reductase [Pseudarcicella sp.]|nr:acyl-CoA reductase [Pseudarcicella sp.]